VRERRKVHRKESQIEPETDEREADGDSVLYLNPF
jgi:hypothetical protein